MNNLAWLNRLTPKQVATLEEAARGSMPPPLPPANGQLAHSAAPRSSDELTALLSEFMRDEARRQQVGRLEELRRDGWTDDALREVQQIAASNGGDISAAVRAIEESYPPPEVVSGGNSRF